MSNQTAEEAIEQAKTLRQSGDLDGCWEALRSVISYPESVNRLNDTNWVPAFMQFAGYCTARGAPETLSGAAMGAALNPQDMNALYGFGNELAKNGADAVAVSVLSRANRITPNVPAILAELCGALEASGHYNAVKDTLLEARASEIESQASEADEFFLTYLLGFAAFVTGDVEFARDIHGQLNNPPDEVMASVKGQLTGLLERHDRIRPISILDSQDLRGWHYALNGSILGHLSHHGMETMQGRYAMVQDSEGLLLEGIRRLEGVLKAWSYPTVNVVILPDRSSHILGATVAAALNIPALPLGHTQLGVGSIVVAYDLQAVDVSILESLEFSQGEILFAHATGWTSEFPLVADVTTMLHQYNVAPWEAGRLRVDPDTQEVARSAADDRPVAEWVELILSATIDTESFDDHDQLAQLARQVGPPPPGHRGRFIGGSPVQSSRFP